jgi:hypothetical protein
MNGEDVNVELPRGLYSEGKWGYFVLMTLPFSLNLPL